MTLTGKNKFGGDAVIDFNGNNVLHCGMSGCGKTTQIAKQMSQTMKDEQSIHIIFDVKGDFLKYYREGDIVLSLHDINGVPSLAQPRWNIMREIISSKYPETTANEIAVSVFSDAIAQSHSPFFPQSACRIFSSILIMISREYRDKPPFTSQVITNSLNFDSKTLIEKLKKYPDLASVSHLIEGAAQTTGGIRAEYTNTLLKVFQGNFLSEGTFSARDFMHKGKGKKLFIEYRFDEQESSRHVIKLILDICMKELLGGTCDIAKTYFYLDEFPLLPALSYIDSLLNFGRSYGAQTIAGIQSVSQLYSSFGHEAAVKVLTGFKDIFVFATNDPESSAYFSNRGGTRVVPHTAVGIDRRATTTSMQLPYIADSELMYQKIGEAYYLPPTAMPYKIKFGE